MIDRQPPNMALTLTVRLHLLPVDRTNLALEHARERTAAAVRTTKTPEEILAHGRCLLRGDPEDRAGL
jgi:hypothetical protein